eukprot:TRINITY_DN12772_c0_g1_i1.p1 TRINITY_DN12772_c0_g1~~TRINITY_DN12772_c0_g1_i1.p1  ORF type:complete len:181 (-),score=42.28 TRINITY_DN12772_c0_g1_i1:197-739(-)
MTTPSNHLQHIPRINSTIYMLNNVLDVCSDTDKFLKTFNDENINVPLEQCDKRITRLFKMNAKLLPKLKKEINPVKKAQMIKNLIKELNLEIDDISQVLNQVTFYAFFELTQLKECSSRVANTFKKHNLSDPVLITDESIANFLYCLKFPRIKNGQKIRNEKLKEMENDGLFKLSKLEKA